MDEIQRDTTFVKKSSVVWRDLDGESVLLDLDSGSYFSLNKVGTLAWGLFNDGRSVAEVISAVCDAYEVDEKEALSDIIALARSLVSEDLMRIGS